MQEVNGNKIIDKTLKILYDKYAEQYLQNRVP